MRIAALALIAAIGIISAGEAEALEYVAGTTATFKWAPASGPVRGYVVLVSRNGGAFGLVGVAGSSDRRITLPAQIGDQIRIQVAAYDENGLGPLSPPSDVVAFVENRPRVPIAGLLDTGVLPDGSAQGFSRDELHYFYSGPATGASTLWQRYLWAEPLGSSRWIGPDRQPVQPGTQVYTLEFELVDVDPATTFVAGYWAVAGSGEIQLNGVATGFSRPDGASSDIEPFVITSGFVNGTNRLEFVVRTDAWSPSGLLVSNLFGTGELVRLR